jgi:hypothetical protein
MNSGKGLDMIPAAALWLLVATTAIPLALSFGHGLEMTDESIYLLTAADPWLTLGHGTLYGFGLHPIWKMAGEQLAAFRWVGFLFVLGATGLFAQALQKVVQASGSAFPRWGRRLILPSLLLAGLGIYSDGIRTPSYNWLAWLGAVFFLSGILPGMEKPPARHRWFWALWGSLGLILMVLAKWGAALCLVVAVALAFGVSGGTGRRGPRSLGWLTAILAGGGMGAALVLLFVAGPGIVTRTLQAGWWTATETGSHGAWILGKNVMEIFYYFYRLGRALIWIVPIALAGWFLWKKIGGRPAPARFVPAVFLAGTALAFLRGYGVGGAPTFSKESLIAGIWVLGVLWGATRLGPFQIAGGKARMGLLLAVPFLLGVGTNTSIADYAGHATLFFLGAGWLVLTPCLGKAGRLAALVMVTSVSTLQASRLITSLEHSYRIGNVWEANIPVASGKEAGQLRLSRDMAAFTDAFCAELQANGFREGSPVVGISDLPGLVYLAGGTSPGVPWFFGHHPSHAKSFITKVLSSLPEDVLARTWVFRRSGTLLPGSVESFWPTASTVPVPRKVGGVSGYVWEGKKEEVEIFAPSR